MNDPVQVTINNGIGVLTLAGAEGNAIDLAMYERITSALAQLGSAGEVRVILIRANGADFSIGEDFQYLAKLEREQRYDEWTGHYHGWIGSTWHNPKLVVAEVQGRALGIGCELALLADVTFAAKSALFGHPETARGMAPWTIWPWLVGPKLAKEYLATGRLMSAERAHLTGLINAALPDAELAEHVNAFAADIATMPAGTPGANKKRINWAFRDVSRVLHDDRLYDVDFGWLVESRAVDQGFYKSVADSDVRTAIRNRDSEFR